MTLKLKSLLEGYAWERKADGSLPTLRDAIAVHEANSGSKPDFLDLDGDGNEKESMKSAAADNTSTEEKIGNYINKARAKAHLRDAKPGDSVYGIDSLGLAHKLSSPSHVDNPKYKKWTIKSESVNEYGEREFDRSHKFGGSSAAEIVEKIEDHVEHIMQDLSTNSNVPSSEKSVILRELVKIADLIDELQNEI